MKNIIIYGKNSFLAKNFIFNYKKQHNLFLFNLYFKNENIFKKKFIKFVKKNKITHIINFAACNDNSLNNNNSKKIFNSNFSLPLTLLEISNNLNLDIFLFLSKEIDKNDSKYDNFYSLSKNLLLEYIKYFKNKNRIRIINIDSVYGPFDLNYERLIPSVIKNILKNKKKKSINLNQSKKMIYVGNVNKIIESLIFSKKKIIYKKIKSTKFYVRSIYNFLKKYHLHKSYDKFKNYKSFITTFDWYLKHYGKTK
tara:strand:- start:244 stop:1002 length:759 start_codon:yes stop_codon:yes gene_type:complete